LNFVLVLALDRHPELRDLTRSYAAILERTARGLGLDGLVHQGTSDLALVGRKVSGNAQKRTRRALLHHGTILHAMDLSLIARFLAEPEKQPAYRGRRLHAEFVRNLPLPAAVIKERIAMAWGAEQRGQRDLPRLDDLIASKYGNPEWVRRF
jgi:lipoate-protein ligase A